MMTTLINQLKINCFLLMVALAVCATLVEAKTLSYNLKIHEKNVNFTGQDIIALAVNDQIPAPTIEARVGDTLEITVENTLDEDTSIHWHGLLLPHNQDGVPYLNTQPIKPHSTFKYKFKVKHSGTYWYHSHSGLQEQRGIYGSIVFHPKEGEKYSVDKDSVIVLSDWNDEDPNQVLANIKKDGEWYALKKDAVQSWDRVLENGLQAVKNRLNSSWTRMGPMDLSDVGYDTFLSNGKNESTLDAGPGDLIRLRLINAGASTYFNVEFAGDPMIIVAADGVDIEPLKAKRISIAMAETYDVLIRVPDNKSYELRATAQDGTGYSSTYIGTGERVHAPHIPRPNLFLVNHSTHDMGEMGHDMSSMQIAHTRMNNDISRGLDHHGHSQRQTKRTMANMHHDKLGMSHIASDVASNLKRHNLPEIRPDTIEYLENYKPLRSPTDTSLPRGSQSRTILLELTGNMERYVWSINEKTLLEEDTVLIRKGENVKFILVNKTMMNHPMHLHGHFFRVLNGQGERSPLKHTVNVPPMETVEIEFEANEEKDWFFHCHNLYHAKNGMARFISYEGSTLSTKETKMNLAHDPWYFLGDMSALSQMTLGKLRTANARDAFIAEYDYNYNKQYDVDIMYERALTRYLGFYVGANLEREGEDERHKNMGIVGVHYVLPLLIESDLRLDSKGKLRLGLASTLQLTPRIKFDWMCNTNKKYSFGLSYEFTKNVLLSASYNSDFKWGIGLRVIF